MTVRVRYTPGSLARVRKIVRKLNPEVEKSMDEQSERSAEDMAALAQSLVPVDTMALHDSITVTGPGQMVPPYSQGKSGRFSGPLRPGQYVITAGNSDVRYAHLVEYGSPPHIAGGMFAGAQIPKVTAQPFFWPAYRAVRIGHNRRVGSAVGKAIRKAKRG